MCPCKGNWATPSIVGKTADQHWFKVNLPKLQVATCKQPPKMQDLAVAYACRRWLFTRIEPHGVSQV